jgi:hypothetical protein
VRTREPRYPQGVAVLPLAVIDRCPIQPRVNISMRLVEQLSASMKAGRHQPLVDVEPAPGNRGRYQIVSGEQRWRAARAAGLTRVLARLHPPLGYLERLEKQFEENHLRADLDPVEEAHCIFLHKTLRDIDVAERLLVTASVAFEPLEDKRIDQREEFLGHLDGLRRLLTKNRINVVTQNGQPIVGPLARWRETEIALGISESGRKAKVAILRLDARLQDALRPLPAQHAIQIARLDDPAQQAVLVERAPDLTHRQVQQVVERLRCDPDITVDAALTGPAVESKQQADPVAFEVQLSRIGDLCRQLVRLLNNLQRPLTHPERTQLRDTLAGVHQALGVFEGESP